MDQVSRRILAANVKAMVGKSNARSSHSFVIDRKEAKKLFNRVEQMTDLEVQLVDTLWQMFVEQGDLVVVCEPVPPETHGVNDAQHQPAESAGTETDGTTEPAAASATSSAAEVGD